MLLQNYTIQNKTSAIELDARRTHRSREINFQHNIKWSDWHHPNRNITQTYNKNTNQSHIKGISLSCAIRFLFGPFFVLRRNTITCISILRITRLDVRKNNCVEEALHFFCRRTHKVRDRRFECGICFFWTSVCVHQLLVIANVYIFLGTAIQSPNWISTFAIGILTTKELESFSDMVCAFSCILTLTITIRARKFVEFAHEFLAICHFANIRYRLHNLCIYWRPQKEAYK